jgi:predicted HAD superfamily Cof-like phosphohydrolase
MPENNNCTLSKTKEWFEKAVSDPELKNFNAQLGTHCEEVEEMLQAIKGGNPTVTGLLNTARDAMYDLGWYLKDNSSEQLVSIPNGIDFLDALCDQIVTATGVAHMHGDDIVGAMDEVNDSNFSKFEDGQPIFDANRKIIKGSGYRKPNLEPFLKK